MQRPSIFLLACGLSAAAAGRGGEPAALREVGRLAADGQEQQARGEFAQECSPFPNQRVVLVTVNGDYVSFFKNWHRYAEPYMQATEHLYVIAEDYRAGVDLEQLQKGGMEFTLVKKEAAVASLLQVPYNSKAYGKVVMKRPEEIKSLLDQGCTVLYSDIDNVWAKDPFVDIGAAAAGNLYVTDDGRSDYWGLSMLDGASTNYCTCFLYVQPHTATRQLMEAWSHGTGHKNQPPFNEELEKMHADSGLVTVMLPPAQFPNGRDAHMYPDATIFHANYLVGERAKVQFFEQRGMWDGAPASEFPAPPPKGGLMHRLCGYVGLSC